MTTIILTSTVNINPNIDHLYQKNQEERISTYLKSILQWLTKTNFKIILVENSGYNFDELNNEKELYKNRFEVITFKENSIEEASYLKNNISKGNSEIFAINYAFNNSKIINSSNFIIKITARYYIDELEKYLNQFDLNNYDCLTQNNRDRCEVIGSHYNNFAFIFNTIFTGDETIYHDYIEHVWKIRSSKYDKILICKEFQIDKTQRGGVNLCYDTI